MSKTSSLNASFEKSPKKKGEDDTNTENLLLHLNLCNALEGIDKDGLEREENEEAS